MTELGFYQLASRPIEAVLPKLLEKAYAAGHRTVVRCRDEAQAAQLDETLWTYDERSFLPHGRVGEGHPILLVSDASAPEGYGLLALPGGAMPDDVGRFDRVLYLFDGNDEAALKQAREDWRAAKARDDVTPVYWRATEGGRWEKAA